MQNKILNVTCLVFAIGAIGMFLPGRKFGEEELRFMIELGIAFHILIFFLGCFLYHNLKPGFASRPIGARITRIVLVSLAASLIIEGTQHFIPGRTPAARDIAGNITGVLLFLSWTYRRFPIRALPLHLLAATAAGILLSPLITSSADHMIAGMQFPIIAGFETPLEDMRFRGGRDRLSISDEYAFQGRKSLRMDMTTQIYSSHSLAYMPGNWSNYSHLHIAVYNPQKKEVKFYIRIEDIKHSKSENQQYTDRFNSSVTLPPENWETIIIPLEKIENSPRNRKMNMEQISRIHFFVAREQEPLTLYLDDIHLKQ